LFDDFVGMLSYNGLQKQYLFGNYDKADYTIKASSGMIPIAKKLPLKYRCNSKAIKKPFFI